MIKEPAALEVLLDNLSNWTLVLPHKAHQSSLEELDTLITNLLADFPINDTPNIDLSWQSYQTLVNFCLQAVQFLSLIPQTKENSSNKDVLVAILVLLFRQWPKVITLIERDLALKVAEAAHQQIHNCLEFMQEPPAELSQVIVSNHWLMATILEGMYHSDPLVYQQDYIDFAQKLVEITITAVTKLPRGDALYLVQQSRYHLLELSKKLGFFTAPDFLLAQVRQEKLDGVQVELYLDILSETGRL